MQNNNIKIMQGQDVRCDESHARCIRIIHTLKNKLGLSEATYRVMLQESFGASSSKELSPQKQSQLIAFLNSQYVSIQTKNASSYKQQNYILFLAKDKISNLSAFCSKIINRQINSIQELSKKEAIKIINALQRYSLS